MYDNKPYVYRGTHKETGEFYIGYRKRNTLPPASDLGIYYSTSSNTISNIGFDNFNWDVIAEFFHPDRKQAGLDAYAFEQLTIFNDFLDPLCLNKHHTHGGNNFQNLGHSDETKLKISIANTGKRRTESQRQRMSESAILRPPMSEDTKLKLLILSDLRMGIPRTKEVRQKISDTLMGHSVSLETRYKMSKSKLGKPINWLGRTHTQESKDKISKANLGKKLTDVTKAKMSVSKMGELNHMYSKTHTQESKDKMAISHTGMEFTEEHKKNLSLCRLGELNHMYGKTHTDESKAKISAMPVPEERKQRMSDSHKGMKYSDETKKKKSESMKEVWCKKKEAAMLAELIAT